MRQQRKNEAKRHKTEKKEEECLPEKMKALAAVVEKPSACKKTLGFR